jgi:alkanesulfonate monooxygenase SsuD/methylene tetrahydromethanopterin reductase-like flavin-dependent oxidoreductase (luciferase family)
VIEIASVERRDERAAPYSNAAIMTTVVAGVTEHIRVGPAGVLLRFQAPYAVADSALLLERLFPGRIDFGLAAGTVKPELEPLLADGRTGVDSAAYFDRKAAEVLELARSRVAEARDSRQLPAFWLLGSSGARAARAGELGAGYSLSLFHRDAPPALETLVIYFEAFARAGHPHSPEANLAVAVRGTGAPPSRFTASFTRSVITGDASACADQIRAMAERYGADEVVVLDTHGQASLRRDMLAALADRLALDRPA